MKKILLTGGSGFIGKNIRESYLSGKYKIIAPSSKELNLIDVTSVDTFFKDKIFDVVLHCAVKPGHRNAKDHSNLFYSNVKMFENLVRHKDKYGRFINLGSGAVYDNSKDIALAKEEEIYKNIPVDEHGFCKYIVAKRIDALEGFTDLNIFGIFGKYEDWQIRFISNAICKTLFGLPITLRQNRVFSYLWVNDLMPVLEYFIENIGKHKHYNVTPDEKAELLAVAELVKTISDFKSEIKVTNPGFGLEYSGDNKKLKAEIGILKFTSLEASVKSLYEYYLQNRYLINEEVLLQDK